MNDTAGIIVYTTPNCQACRMTKIALDNQDITYRVVDLTRTPAALAYVQDELGYTSAPIVVIDDHNHWAGFRPDLIALLHP
jgi:glutaredoxin-like protein NrdH